MTQTNNIPDSQKYPRRWVMGQGYVYDNPENKNKEPKQHEESDRTWDE